jgi:hypothetical protein
MLNAFIMASSCQFSAFFPGSTYMTLHLHSPPPQSPREYESFCIENQFGVKKECFDPQRTRQEIPFVAYAWAKVSPKQESSS